MKKLTSLFIVLTLIFSCKEKNKKVDDVAKIVTEWMGKEIRFPQNATCSVLGKDTSGIDLLTAEYKVLLYIDSVGCTSCKLRLHEWKSLIQEADSLFGNRLSFLFFFHPKDKKELSFLLKRDQFDYPVYMDNENQINQLNGFPRESEYQCFLLNGENKVIMIGNPVFNPNIWELYKKQISVITKKE